MSKNIISVSWGDHLAFGESDGRLHTPESLWHRIESWKGGQPPQRPACPPRLVAERLQSGKPGLYDR